MRIQLKKSLVCSIIIVLSSLILLYGQSSQPVAGKKATETISPKDEIIKLYQELIDIRQKAVEQNRFLLEIG